MASDLLLGLAENPALPPALVDRLVALADDELAYALTRRPDLTVDQIESLAARSELAALALAGDDEPAPADPPDLTDLAADRTHDVQRQLPHDPAVPLDVLIGPAAVTRIGPSLLSRVAAASPEEVRALAMSTRPEVRMLVAERRDLPDDVRDRLAADGDAKVLKSVAGHPGLSEELMRAMVVRHGVRVLAKVATNPGASGELLLALVSHVPAAQKVFRAVAVHPNATAPALIRCLDDLRARPLAAAHPALPRDMILRLLADEDPEVAAAAASNPSLPPAAMTALLDDGATPPAP
jgi:hypothetical protein